jgi:hypothetical protein
MRSIRYIDANSKDYILIARELLGIESESAFRVAVQNFIEEAGLEFHEFCGVGVLVACPKCGASPDKLKSWEAMDDRFRLVFRATGSSPGALRFRVGPSRPPRKLPTSLRSDLKRRAGFNKIAASRDQSCNHAGRRGFSVPLRYAYSNLYQYGLFT